MLLGVSSLFGKFGNHYFIFCHEPVSGSQIQNLLLRSVSGNRLCLEVPHVQELQNYSIWRIVMKFSLQHCAEPGTVELMERMKSDI